MESGPSAPANVAGRREPSTDPVKAQGILNSVTKKAKLAAKLWPQQWEFYNRIHDIQEEEALKIGMTIEEYRAALRSRSSQPEPTRYPVTVDPSPAPLPLTSSGNLFCLNSRLQPTTNSKRRLQEAAPTFRSGCHRDGVIGRRARCPLERYGRLVKTDRDYPIRPPLEPGQIYDPYQQTIVFLGSVDGDPISYKLPPSRCEVTDDMWAGPLQLTVSPLCWDNLQRAMSENEPHPQSNT